MKNLDQTLELLARTTTPILPREFFENIHSTGTIDQRGKLYDFYLTFGGSVFGDGADARARGEVFLLEYLSACLGLDKGHGDHLGCYESGWEIARLIGESLRTGDNAFAAKLIEVIDRAYVEGDGQRRTCIETACLEHLYENPTQVQFFVNQKISVQLRTAWEAEALRQRSHVKASPFGSAV
jgi:hypothetical protein